MVIDDMVYDEISTKSGPVYELSGVVDGHNIFAGFLGGYYFIRIYGQQVAKKLKAF